MICEHVFQSRTFVFEPSIVEVYFIEYSALSSTKDHFNFWSLKCMKHKIIYQYSHADTMDKSEPCVELQDAEAESSKSSLFVQQL